CLYVALFFFQAEDGIRDFHVTGVQTCALPIYPHPGPGAAAQPPGDIGEPPGQRRPDSAPLAVPGGQEAQGGSVHRPHQGTTLGRSEERRVGKESREWWSREDSRKKVSLREGRR